MSKNLVAKASMIQMPPAAPSPALDTAASAANVVPVAPMTSPDARPKTAPGSMAMFMASQSAAVREADDLRQKLKAFDGAQPLHTLDPGVIRPSRLANRHPDSFAGREFEELKSDIAASGTNVQPICVRALAVTEGEIRFELVFGHRRHRACMELGLPVQAFVAELDDRALFEAMERENRARKSLSAWEQGMMYRRALDSGLYASQRKLAEAVGVDLALVSKSVALARLPDAVVGCFASPLDIQFRWAQPLSEALQRDPEGIVARAQALKGANASMRARQVLESLINTTPPVLNRSTPQTALRIGRAGKGVVLDHDDAGRSVLRFDPGVLTPERQQALIEWLRNSLDAKR